MVDSRFALFGLIASISLGCSADLTGSASGSNGTNGGSGGNAGTSAAGTAGTAGTSAGTGGSSGEATGGAAGSGGATAGTGSVGTMPPRPDTPPAPESAGTLPMLRLTHREYRNTMADLLGTTTNPAAGFEPDGPGNSGFETPNNVATLNAQMYMEQAALLAESAMTGGRLTVPCTAPANMAAETTCASEFIATFGLRAFRRPVAAGEATDLLALFATARGLGFDFRQSLTHVVSEMLQSPNFLYHWEIGDEPPGRDAADATLVNLTPYQLASRLSYFLWESMPDDTLLAAAGSGALSTPEGVLAQAQRLLADRTRSKNALFNFHRQWLHVDNLEDLAPGTNLGEQLGVELETFVASVLLEGDGSLSTLLTAPYTFANATTAPEYGATATGSVFTRLELDPSQRLGVLMQVPFLRTNGTAPPVDRGLVVYRQLLCGQVSPPPLVVPEVEPPGTNLTTRERFAEHAKNECATGCHALFDPWGFAFENFDAIGRYRTMEAGKPIDATGEPLANGMLGGTTPNGVDIPFNSGLELVHALAANEEVRWCTARQWSRYMLGRLENGSDAGSIENAYKAAVTPAAGYSVRDFLLAAVRTKAFRYRTPSAGETL